MSIPFTEYVLPDGKKRDEKVERPPEIEALAQQFIDGGGWYEAEILMTGAVSLTACMEIDEESQDIEIRICQNGPDVLNSVDDLVRASVAFQVTGATS